MSAVRPFCVICEGKSEVSYLARLMRFLGDEAAAMGLFASPVGFVGKPAVHGAGGGDCRKVSAAFKREFPNNRKATFRVWVDADIYIREWHDEVMAFKRHSPIILGQSGKMPPFSFSAPVFEDFLAMHFDDALYEAWRRAFAKEGHFLHPLHECDYIPLFQSFWHRRVNADGKNYEKGDIPADLVTTDSIRNLFRHCDDPEVVASVRAITPEPTFGEFLRTSISAVFPHLAR